MRSNARTSSAALVVALLSTSPAWAAVKPTTEEIARADEWVAARFGDRPSAEPPFSFTYDGKPSSEILKTWKVERQARKVDDARTEHVITYTEPATRLVLTCKAIHYSDFPTVEWTLYLKNTGQKDTPILENLQAIDLQLQRDKDEAEFVLNHNQGSVTSPQDFQPFATPLGPGKMLPIGTHGGRPMNANMPYFNVQWGKQGMIVVLSWVGQWATYFNRDAETGLRIIGGQEQTHFKLLPGEEVRSPLVALQFYQGTDKVRAQNIWRRWMIDHNLPRPGGKPFPPVFSATASDLFPSYVAQAEGEVAVIKGCTKRNLKFDYWWIDAGWYPCRGQWQVTGTWEVDSTRYPNGLQEIADCAHDNGMKLTVWFEPERVVAGTWLAENHPEWILGGKNGGLVDLGKPEAWNWVVNRVDKLITENHIDMYRQDFNMGPLDYWRGNDAPDRQGITEIKHVVGLLAYWDELKKRHPDMPFDNCASGGQRNVLEMMRRGLPLSKTDHAGGTISSQSQLHGLAPWLPYFGSGGGAAEDLYHQRCNIAPWTAYCWDTRKDTLNYEGIRKFLDEWRRVIPYYWGDFYPLTPYSLDENTWMAWQFDGPAPGAGIVQAFRREKCEAAAQVYKLQALDGGVEYEVENLDTGKTEKVSGAKLMDDGLKVELAAPGSAAIIMYRKAQQ